MPGHARHCAMKPVGLELYDRRTGANAVRLMDTAPDTSPPDVRQPRKWPQRGGIERVINEERLSLNCVACNESPVTGILRVVSIVSQHHVLPRRDDNRTPVVTCRAAFLVRSGRGELALPIHAGGIHVVLGIG